MNGNSVLTFLINGLIYTHKTLEFDCGDFMFKILNLDKSDKENSIFFFQVSWLLAGGIGYQIRTGLQGINLF